MGLNDFDQALQEVAREQAATKAAAPVAPPTFGPVAPFPSHASTVRIPPPVTDTDPALQQVADEERQTLESQLRLSGQITPIAPPDRAARIYQLSRRYGLPSETVAGNFDQIERNAKIADTPYAQMLRETPTLSAWASNPTNAAVAQGDMENLGALEWLVSAPQRAFAQELNNQWYSALRTKSLFGPLTEEERYQMNAYKQHAQLGGELGAGNSWFRGAVKGTAKLLAFLGGASPYGLVGAAGGAIVGGAGGTLVEPGGGTIAGAIGGAKLGYEAGTSFGLAKTAFETSAAGAYDRFLEIRDVFGQPIDPEAARGAALAVGAVNGALLGVTGEQVGKALGVNKLTSFFTTDAVTAALQRPSVAAALSAMMRRYTGHLATGTALMAAQEAVTILGQEFTKKLQANPQPVDGKAIANEMLTATGQALRDFSIVSAVGPFRAMVRDVDRARAATVNQNFFEALGETTANSKTFQRLPEAGQDLVAKITKDGPIETLYVPTEAFTTYWQSKGVDPAEMATALTGKSDALETATRSGEDLAIPTANYAAKIAPTEHNGFFAQEMRLGDPDAMNAREATAFNDKLQRMAAEAASRNPEPAKTTPIREALIPQLEAAGIPHETADAYVTLHEAAFGTMAERAGVDPVALYEQYRLRVQRPDLQTPEAALPSAAGETGAVAPPPAAPRSLIEDLITPSQSEPTAFGQDERGSIVFGPDNQATINLLAQADLSSFLHESGHFFFEVMGDLHDQVAKLEETARTPEQQKLAADYQSLLESVGATDRASVTTEHHEQLARSFEAYLREGKAPSVEMRSTFARFRAWLVGIYRTLKGLNVELSPEVRGVFDRMLASDNAIAEAEAAGKVDAMFTTAKDAGMTEDQFAAYRATAEEASTKAREELEQRILGEVRREQTEQWKAQRDAIEKEVTAETNQQPVYQAEAAIRKGTRPDGSPLVEGQTAEPMRLSTEALKRYFPDGKIPKRFAFLHSKEGMEPDVVASMFGFSSGDEMVRALESTPNMRQAIGQETNRRMAEQHPSMMLDGSIFEKAKEVLANDAHETIVREELRALAARKRELTPDRLRGSMPRQADIRAAAQQRIGSMVVRDLKPETFWSASRRSARKAIDAAATQDIDAAIVHKQQELLTLALYREAVKAKEQAQASFDWVKGQNKPSGRERLGKAGGSYLAQWDRILERYEFARVSNKDLDRRASLGDWVTAQQREGIPLDLPRELLDESLRVNWREMTVEQLQGVTDGMKQIAYWARMKNRLLRDQAKRELTELAQDGAKSLDENHLGKPREVVIEPRLPGWRRKRSLEAWELGHRPLSSIVRQMDGFHDGGFMFENVWRPAHEARNAARTLGQDAAVKWKAIHEERFAGEESTLYDQLYIPEIKNSLSTAARLVVALNYGNEGNRERLYSNGIGNSGPLNEGQVRAILDTLTERDWKYVRSMAELIGSYRPQIAEVSKRVTGVEPKWVDPKPFQTKFGEMPGWYYPISYEGLASARASASPEATFASIVGQAAYSRFQTAQGHTEARAAHTGIPLRADLGVVAEHLQQVIHDVTHREMLIDAGRLLGKGEVQEAIYRNYGESYYKEILGAFRDLAIGPLPAPNWYRVVGQLRRGAVLARLAWNFATIGRHLTNVTHGMARVGPVEVLRQIPKTLGGARAQEASAAWINETSDFMAGRWNRRMEEIASTAGDIGLNRGKWASGMRDAAEKMGIDPDLVHRFSDSYLYGIHKIIQLAEIPTWGAAYRKALDGGREHADAVAMADQAVVDAFGGGETLDQPAIQRHQIGKLFMTFGTFSLTLNRLNYEIFHKDASIGRKVLDAALVDVIPLALGAAIVMQGQKKKKFVEAYAEEAFKEAMGMFVFTRELSSALSRPEYTGPSSMAPFGTATRVVWNTGQAIKEGLEGGEGSGKHIAKAAKGAAEVGGQFFPVPVFQIEKTAAGIRDISDNPKASYSEIFFGPKK